MKTFARRDAVEIEVLYLLTKRFKTVYAAEVHDHLSKGVFGIPEQKIDVHSYDNVLLFRLDYCLQSSFSKWKGWTKTKPDEACINNWKVAERRCFETNTRINSLYYDPIIPMHLIFKMQDTIKDIIGERIDVRVLERYQRWSSGATFSSKKGSTVGDKIEKHLTVTNLAYKHIPDFLFGYQTPIQIVRGNRNVMVPKNAKTHRMISCEPTINALLQQGVGRYFKDRLLSVGVNLFDQKVNQKLAFEALVDGLSTVDLEMASDTLSYSLVELLLPPEWFAYLDDIRSHLSQFNGSWKYLEKFSSMGNAFTFELESLIFYAIAKVLSDHHKTEVISVFGDDVIIDSKVYADFKSVSKFLGFTVNETKSYTYPSRFYESCGKHYFDLEDVTPFYQKDVVKSRFDYIAFHNRIYRWGERNDCLPYCRNALYHIVERYKLTFPRDQIFPKQPCCLEGDFGFIVEDTDIEIDKHGDFRLNCLVHVSNTYDGIIHHNIYKDEHLRTNRSRNSPDGHVKERIGERYILKRRKKFFRSGTYLGHGDGS